MNSPKRHAWSSPSRPRPASQPGSSSPHQKAVDNGPDAPPSQAHNNSRDKPELFPSPGTRRRSSTFTVPTLTPLEQGGCDEGINSDSRDMHAGKDSTAGLGSVLDGQGGSVLLQKQTRAPSTTTTTTGSSKLTRPHSADGCVGFSCSPGSRSPTSRLPPARPNSGTPSVAETRSLYIAETRPKNLTDTRPFSVAETHPSTKIKHHPLSATKTRPFSAMEARHIIRSENRPLSATETSAVSAREAHLVTRVETSASYVTETQTLSETETCLSSAAELARSSANYTAATPLPSENTRLQTPSVAETYSVLEYGLPQSVVNRTSENGLSRYVADRTPENGLYRSVADRTPQNELSQSVADRTSLNELSRPVADRTSLNELSRPVADRTPQNELSRSVADRTPQNGLSQFVVNEESKNRLAPSAADKTPHNGLSQPLANRASISRVLSLHSKPHTLSEEIRRPPSAKALVKVAAKKKPESLPTPAHPRPCKPHTAKELPSSSNRPARPPANKKPRSSLPKEPPEAPLASELEETPLSDNELSQSVMNADGFVQSPSEQAHNALIAPQPQETEWEHYMVYTLKIVALLTAIALVILVKISLFVGKLARAVWDIITIVATPVSVQLVAVYKLIHRKWRDSLRRIFLLSLRFDRQELRQQGSPANFVHHALHNKRQSLLSDWARISPQRKLERDMEEEVPPAEVIDFPKDEVQEGVPSQCNVDN